MALLHSRRRLQFLHDAGPALPMRSMDIFLMTDGLSSDASQRRTSGNALGQGFPKRGLRGADTDGRDLLGIPGQWGRGRRIPVDDRGHDAHVDDEEPHS